MSEVPTVGIIGGGFVGGSIAKGFQHYTDVKVFDLESDRANASFEDTIEQEVLFVCVNTPMRKNGSVDTSAVEGVLEDLRGNMPEGHQNKDVIIKSTIPPDDIGRLILEFADDMFLIYSPEFLTERTAEYDFNQSNRLIFGTLQNCDVDTQKDKVYNLFQHRFPEVQQHWCRFEEASLVKYFTNVFFSVKIALMNEFAQVAEAFDLEPNEVIGKVMLDQRIGRSHWMVPGHDGKRGFGGHCFPKDINGYLHIARELGVDPLIGQAAWDKNLEVRPEQDWKEDKGRAVSNDED
jgi:UDPglucose 6-dehydrogenase